MNAKFTRISSIKNRHKIIFIELIFWGLMLALYFITDYSVDKREGATFLFRNPGMLLCLLSILPMHWMFITKLERTTSLANQKQYILHSTNTSLQKWLSHIFFTRGVIFIFLALAQPSVGKQKISGTVRSMELVVCLDVSNSMNVKDMGKKVSRINASKLAITDLINHLSGEKIGVCIFAGASLVQLPLTTDYEAAKLFLQDIGTDLMSLQGTNISSALKTAEKMFSPVENGKAILLITDGEDHDGNALEVAQSLHDQSIELHVLGVGSSNGGPLPLDAQRPELGYKKSKTGQLLISKPNPKLIEAVAYAGSGSYLLSSSAYPSVHQLLTEINQIKRTDLRDLSFETRSNNYRIPLGLALCCFLIVFYIKYLEIRN